MIGKIMSEAAHTIIGMFSARPEGMEQRTSNLDFGSLLRSPEQQPHSAGDATDVGAGEVENSEIETSDPAAVQNWSAQIVLPAFNQNIGLGPWSRSISSGAAEQQLATNEAEAFAPTGHIDGRKAALEPSASVKSQDPLLSALSRQDVSKGLDFNGRARLVLGENQATDDGASDDQPESSPVSRMQNNADVAIIPGHGRVETKDLVTNRYSFTAPPATSETARPLAAPVRPLMAKPTDQSSLQDDAAILEPQLTAKALDTSASPVPPTSFSVNPAVRETVQAAAAFDLSAPRVAERLAAEISELSASGETKKFEINPRNLGRMEIIFTMRGSIEIIEIQTEHRSAKDIIMQHSQVLQEMLKSQGREDLTFRVDVKDNMTASSRADNSNLFQQDGRDAREQQARSARPSRTLPAFDRAEERDSASDNSRYA